MNVVPVLRPLCSLLAAGACWAATSTAAAQPSAFVNLGVLTAPVWPPYARQAVDDSAVFPEQTPPLTFAVRWARLELTQAMAGDLYLDIDTRNYNAVGVTLALFDAAGQLVASDDGQGSLSGGVAPALAFGSTAERVPYVSPEAPGRDGTLAAGVYWLAVVAGTGTQVSLGGGWSVATTAAPLTLGFDDGELYMELGMYVGNRSAFPRPVNDDCENAITISEDVGATPAWTGNSQGATQDGQSNCYTTLINATNKDLWFNYVPSQTGWATVTLSSSASGGQMPPLTRYLAGCGSPPVRCAGGGSFLSPVGTRLTFAVTQGVPVLLGAAMRAADWGPLTLNIDLVGPPCDLGTPAITIPENEPACGDALNDGCIAGPGLFDLIQLGETVTGRLYNTRTSRDVDSFVFHLPFATTFRVTAAAQLPIRMTVRSYSETSGCPGSTGGAASSLFYRDVCQPISFSTTGVGSYVVTINHDALDEFDCTNGAAYGGYWLTLVDVACDVPVFAAQPANGAACVGGSASFTAAVAGGATVTRGWEWELVLGANRLWRPVSNGVFADAGSAAVVSGAGTDTLTLSNVDAAAAVRFRSTARSCGLGRSRPVTLSLRPADQCGCPADYNRDSAVTVQDIFDFLRDYFLQAPAADVDGSGQVGVQDIFEYLRDYFAGCP